MFPNDPNAADGLGELASFAVILVPIMAVLYAYFSVCLMIIARKTQTPNGWMAWIPLLNVVLMCHIARKSAAWILLFVIPFINIIAILVIWSGMAKARGKSGALALLLFIPGLNLLLPAILAAGAEVGGDQGEARYPRIATPDNRPQSGGCSSCGALMSPSDVFCGNCGQPQTQPTPSQQPLVARNGPVQRPPSRGSGTLVGLLLCGGVALLVCCGGVGYFFGWPPGNYQPPARQTPSLPARLAGTMSVLPMDTATQNPVRPTSIASQRFDGNRGTKPPATVNVPTEQLPPGLDPQQIPQWAGGMTTVTYRGGTPNTSTASHVNVHVIDTAGRNSGPAITNSITQAVGGQQDPIQVQSPTGATFTGTRVQAPESVIYILINQLGDLVIVIYAPGAASQPAAERLASNLGNSQGMTDPELAPYICVLPAMPPFGLEIQEMRTFGSQELAASMQAMQGTLNQPGVQGGAQLATQLQQIMPQQLTITTYSDEQGRDWGSLVCDYGNPRTAWFIWTFIDRLFGSFGGTGRVAIHGGKGVTFSEGDGQILIFFKGPYIVLLMGPSAEPVERLVELGTCLQM